MILEYFMLAAVVGSVAVTLFYTAVTGISPIPSSSISRRKMLTLLPIEIDGPILELGAGWGTLAFPLAKRYPRCVIHALELSPVPWLFMRARNLLFRYRNLKVRRVNFLRHSFKDAKAVVCYLHEEAFDKARPKLEAELEPGTIVISNTFIVPGWEPEGVYRLDDSFCPEVYVYRVPGVSLDS